MYHDSLATNALSYTSYEEQQVSVEVEHTDEQENETIDNDVVVPYTHVYEHDNIQYSPHVFLQQNRPIEAEHPRRNRV